MAAFNADEVMAEAASTCLCLSAPALTADGPRSGEKRGIAFVVPSSQHLCIGLRGGLAESRQEENWELCSYGGAGPPCFCLLVSASAEGSRALGGACLPGPASPCQPTTEDGAAGGVPPWAATSPRWPWPRAGWDVAGKGAGSSLCLHAPASTEETPGGRTFGGEADAEARRRIVPSCYFPPASALIVGWAEFGDRSRRGGPAEATRRTAASGFYLGASALAEIGPGCGRRSAAACR